MKRLEARGWGLESNEKGQWMMTGCWATSPKSQAPSPEV